jgi:catechol 2,3-dioxygenase-like lactoylglutathione lyase family enzyme
LVLGEERTAMVTELDLLISRYEGGQISRRDLLGTLAALLLPVSSPTATALGVGPAKQLNHVTLLVPNVERARAFYQDLFGMSVLTRQEPGVNLRVGVGFLGLYPAAEGERGRIDHFCLGVDHFDAEETRQTLGARGLEATIRLRGNTKELYFADPDGITVQVQDVRYRGGIGPLGDQDPP